MFKFEPKKPLKRFVLKYMMSATRAFPSTILDIVVVKLRLILVIQLCLFTISHDSTEETVFLLIF